ncbi:MAG: PAS domain S-box protein [Desulfobaccales bacterium]
MDSIEHLKARVKKFLAAKGPDLERMPWSDVQELVQELQAHQGELEKQNQTLRLSQEVLAKSQDRYATLYDFAPVAYFTLDPHGLISEVNCAGVRLLGEPRDSLLQTPFIRFVAPGNHEAFQTHLYSKQADGVSQSGDLLLRPHQGPPFSASLESLAVVDAGGKVVQYHTVVRNITKRKQAEENLRKSEALYRLIVETANEGIWGLDADCQTTYINLIIPKMLGYQMEEMLHRPLTDFVFPEDLPDQETSMAQLRQGLDGTYERRLKRKDGSELWCIISARSLIDGQGQFQGAFAMFADITRRKQAEEALRLAAHQWQATFDAMSDGICLMDLNCRILGCNQAMASLVGQPIDEILGCLCYEVVHGTSQPISECPLATMCQTRQREEVVLPHKERWFKVTVDPILDDGGALLGAVHRIADITRLKKSEEALQESEAHFRQLFDSVADAVFLHDRGRIVEVNQQACRSLGYTREELLGLRVRDIEVGISPQELQKLHNQNPLADTFCGIHRRKDGSTFPVEVKSSNFPTQGHNLRLAAVRDITAQRQAEQAIRESEKLYRSLFENMLNGFAYCKMLFEHNQPHDFIYLEANKSFEVLTGLKNIVGKKVSEVIPGLYKGNPELFEIYGRVALTGKPEKFEIYVKALKKWLSISVYSPAKEYFVAILDDITQRKQAQEALRQSRETLRVLLDATPAGVCLLDPQGIILAVNKELAQRLGKTFNELVGTRLLDYLSSDQHQTFQHRMAEIKCYRQPLHFEDFNGDHIFDVYVHPILSAAGELVGLAVLSIDITERKQAEEALRRSRETLRVLLDATPAAVVLLNPHGIILAANKIVAERLGKPIKEMVGTCMFDYLPADLSKGRRAHIEEARSTGKPLVFEDRRGGLICDNYVHPIYSGAGNLVGFALLSVDITARKQAEEALAQQSQFLQLLIDTIPTPVFYKDAEGRYLGCNQGFLDYHGVTKEEMVGHTVDCLPDQELARKYRQKDLELFNNPGVQVYENVMPLPDGRNREVVINKATFLKGDGAVGGLIGVIIDITELKNAQKQLRALAAQLAEAEEKERHILARELHDEVGQGLTALGLNLTLLKTQMPRETAAPLLTRLADAVALVEKTGETIRNVMAELRPPVLDDYGLLSALRWYGEEFSRRTGISVEVQGEEAAPRLTRWVELALFRIAQEALTNVAKHAKASRVELTEEVINGTIRLIIADNGVGFDQSQLGQPEGRCRWGLMNMSERAAAAGGSCHIESQPEQGTRVIVKVSR